MVRSNAYSRDMVAYCERRHPRSEMTCAESSHRDQHGAVELSKKGQIERSRTNNTTGSQGRSTVEPEIRETPAQRRVQRKRA